MNTPKTGKDAIESFWGSVQNFSFKPDKSHGYNGLINEDNKSLDPDDTDTTSKLAFLKFKTQNSWGFMV